MDKASKNKKGRCALKQKGTQLASSAASPDIYDGWSHRHAMKRTRHVNITVKVTNWHARLHPKVCNSIGIAWVIEKKCTVVSQVILSNTDSYRICSSCWNLMLRSCVSQCL